MRWIGAMAAALMLVGCWERVCNCVDGSTESIGDPVEPETDVPPDGNEPDPASDPDASDPGVEPPPGGEEARGVWVTRWDYTSASDIETIMESVAGAGFNQVYFQVRGRADAFYDSNLEPWASELGSLGEDPGWDPLEVAVDEAHERDLEIHAWMNTFPVWSGASHPPSTVPQHVMNAHPEWICADETGTPMGADEGYVFGSPGNPELQDHIAAVTVEIAGSYDVDGIHLDYIRYPGIRYCHDAVSEARYAVEAVSSPGLTWEDWQRDQVTATVRKVREATRAVREDVVLSAAVWGIYRNTWGWSSVSQGYVEFYQDPRAWSEEGLVDAVAPMIYWSIAEPYGARLDFRAILDDHVSGISGARVYAGIEGNHDSFSEIEDQIAYSRSTGAAGYSIFAYSHLVSNDSFDDFASGPNAVEAWPPGR